MPDQKISQLTAAATPLAGTETVPLVQGGANVKATVQDIANLAGGGGGGFSPLTFASTGTIVAPMSFVLLAPIAVHYQNKVVSSDLPVGGPAAFFYTTGANSGVTNLTINGLGGWDRNTLTITSEWPNGSLTLPDFKVCGTTLRLFSAGITEFNVPKLQAISGELQLSSGSFTSLNFPMLEFVGTFLSLSTSIASLQSISFPAIIEIGSSINLTQTTNFTSFTLGSTLKKVGTTTSHGATFSGSALNQASVDNILVRLAALDGTNGTVPFSNRTVTIAGSNSAPSATGAAAKATLIARGCTVTTN